MSNVIELKTQEQKDIDENVEYLLDGGFGEVVTIVHAAAKSGLTNVRAGQ